MLETTSQKISWHVFFIKFIVSKMDMTTLNLEATTLRNTKI